VTTEADLSRRARAWVERTPAAQGVPVKLSDPVVLRRIADIFGEARDAREKGAHDSSRGSMTLRWVSVPE
jgi:hypothetical protein